MTMEPNPASDHILDWLEGSVSFFPSFLDDPYNTDGIEDYQLWGQGQDIGYQVEVGPASPNAISPSKTPTEPYSSNNPSPPNSDLPKKRNASDALSLKSSQNHKSKKSKSRPVAVTVTVSESDNGDAVVVEGSKTVKKSGWNKKGLAKANGNNCNNGNNNNNKEGRWAEQLLNPCALALAAGNLNRVQHLLYVLHELASPSGDANHRLAGHGLRALTHHLSSFTSFSSSSASSAGHTTTFAYADPRFFQRSLLKFYEVSPWFSFPNNIANSSILQILAEEPKSSQQHTLHILDIGVSHGFQWPTFLEALTRRPGGPPPLVRLTVVTAFAENDQNMETPFAVGPPGDNFSSRLLGFAKSMNINLQINRLDNHPLQNLNAQILKISPDETFIVCAQFRLHQLNHNTPDERSEFLKLLWKMEPKGVILSENNMECCCSSCGNFATGFERRVEFLWKFLESISSAFKGRESEERRLMEGEAAKALTNQREMNEGKEKWCERMKEAGFAGEIFGEDAIDGGRALLRKYDNNWEMRVEENSMSVGLWWKGQPVSFCTLWKLNENDKGGSDSTIPTPERFPNTNQHCRLGFPAETAFVASTVSTYSSS
ncbi:nodulation-signaling pathway 1 protein [Senna tora]|uniref:Nodulation-signaling pathway 1 protein n=1 Tax=Senna tora TaxID=362788 RepID=A0A834T2M3_9FABA|nr:nodulation-signaling pathway 1 protein [Senna tora]